MHCHLKSNPQKQIQGNFFIKMLQTIYSYLAYLTKQKPFRKKSLRYFGNSLLD